MKEQEFSCQLVLRAPDGRAVGITSHGRKPLASIPGNRAALPGEYLLLDPEYIKTCGLSGPAPVFCPGIASFAYRSMTCKDRPDDKHGWLWHSHGLFGSARWFDEGARAAAKRVGGGNSLAWGAASLACATLCRERKD